MNIKEIELSNFDTSKSLSCEIAQNSFGTSQLTLNIEPTNVTNITSFSVQSSVDGVNWDTLQTITSSGRLFNIEVVSERVRILVTSSGANTAIVSFRGRFVSKLDSNISQFLDKKTGNISELERANTNHRFLVIENQNKGKVYFDFQISTPSFNYTSVAIEGTCDLINWELLKTISGANTIKSYVVTQHQFIRVRFIKSSAITGTYTIDGRFLYQEGISDYLKTELQLDIDTNVVVAKKVFVSQEYGSDSTGEVENLAKPFLTLDSAITAMNLASGIKDASNAWTVILIDGVFSESVQIQPYVSIESFTKRTINPDTSINCDWTKESLKRQSLDIQVFYRLKFFRKEAFFQIRLMESLPVR